MPMPVSEFEPKDVRMTLLQDNFISEEHGRHLAGTVVLVDESTARRWRARGIAVDSAKTDKTLIEQKRAAIEALQAELDEIPGGRRPGVYDAMIGREDVSPPPEDPSPPRRAHRAKAADESSKGRESASRTAARDDDEHDEQRDSS